MSDEIHDTEILIATIDATLFASDVTANIADNYALLCSRLFECNELINSLRAANDGLTVENTMLHEKLQDVQTRYDSQREFAKTLTLVLQATRDKFFKQTGDQYYNKID